MLFALGRADASLAFLGLLPPELRDKVNAVLALKLLAALWSQYRIDCGINHGRTLLSCDNGYEQRIFTALIGECASWEPLRSANALIRTHAPALTREERDVYDSEIDGRLDLLAQVRERVGHLPAALDPVRRSLVLIDQCQRFDALGEYGVCWAVNLASALGADVLRPSSAGPPSPALFRREMFRADRSVAWRIGALCAALAGSAHAVSGFVFASFADVSAFESVFLERRSNSRLGEAFMCVTGIGELTPSQLARLVGCSEPGARKMLRQLADKGFLVPDARSASYLVIERFHLALPNVPWLASFSIADAARGTDLLDG